jgi:hypothetical protein
MKHIPFRWRGPGPLYDELYRPFERISAFFYHSAWRGATSVTLWRKDGSGLKVFNEMYDVLPRLEVGVLKFEIVSDITSGEQIVDLKGKFQGKLKVSKLSITESDVTVESGVVFTCKDEIAIVAGAFPLTLALQGLEFDYPGFDPEYPWDCYQRLVL